MTDLFEFSSRRHLLISDVDLDRQGVCTACDEFGISGSRCQDTFVCAVCNRTYNKCASLPGGLEAEGTECNNCASRREFMECRQLEAALRFYSR